MTEQTDTLVIGGGQAGLAISYYLTQQHRDHVILEQHHRIGETWRSRWDSFTLVTPNWQLRLPGFPCRGNEPDGFLSRDQKDGAWWVSKLPMFNRTVDHLRFRMGSGAGL